MGSWIGLFAAGITNGSFAVPMKTARGWNFHQIWGLFSLLSMMIIPCLAVAVAIPAWPGIIQSLPLGGIAKLVILGLLWGIAALLYGVAVEMLGVALGVSILLGLSIVVGAIVPRILTDTLLTVPYRDILFAAGLIIMLGGIVICARSGRSGEGQRSATQLRKGLFVAVLGGLGSPLLNIGIQYGISLLKSAPHTVLLDPAVAQWVAWALFLSAAALMQAGYCFSRVLVDVERRSFIGPGARAEFVRVLIMAVSWSASIFLYAGAVAGLGRQGPSIGWPIFMALIIVTSNVWGVLLGEWKNRPRGAFNKMVAGSVLLIGATFLIAQGG